MIQNDTTFSFAQFSDYCLARSSQRGMSFKTILDEYIAAHPTHAADFAVHYQQHPELYPQLITQINTLRSATNPAHSEESINATNWKDRMHSDSEDRGEERGFERF